MGVRISHEGPHFGPKTTAESVHLSTELDYVEVAEKVIRKMQRDFDAAVLAQCETELASFGYVKVIRCRDCKHHEKLTDGMGVCHALGIAFANMSDGYCAWGERRSE